MKVEPMKLGYSVKGWEGLWGVLGPKLNSVEDVALLEL